jgi:hypothetical protein
MIRNDWTGHDDLPINVDPETSQATQGCHIQGR